MTSYRHSYSVVCTPLLLFFGIKDIFYSIFFYSIYIKKKGKMEVRHAKVLVLLQAKLLQNQIVLIVVFFWVVKMVFVDKNKKEHRDV